MATYYLSHSAELYHYGVLGMKWGVRRYQNADGTLTVEGRKRYGSVGLRKLTKDEETELSLAKNFVYEGSHTTEQSRRLWEKYDKKRKKIADKYKDKYITLKDGRQIALMPEKEEAELSDYENATAFWKTMYDTSNKFLKVNHKTLIDKYGSKRIGDIKEVEAEYGKRIVGGMYDSKLIGTALTGISVSALTSGLALFTGLDLPGVHATNAITSAMSIAGLSVAANPLKYKEREAKNKVGFDPELFRKQYRARKK